MSAADALLAALPPVTFVVGKGGVGKTTCAAAFAIHAADAVETLLLSTDPARALPSVLDRPVGADATPVPGVARLAARQLEAAPLRDAFMARWRSVLAMILDRGTYLDEADIEPLVDTALPGGDEIFAALELARLLASGTDGSAKRRIFVDTAPTGHTLRLLALPQTFRALVRLLDAMQDKHRFMVRTLMRGYRSDEADAFLADMRRQVDELETALRDPARCAAVLVTGRHAVVEAESRRYVAALGEMGISVAAVVWNNEDSAGDLGVPASFTVPRLPESPIGPDGLRRWLAAMRRGGARGGREPKAEGRKSRAQNRERNAGRREPSPVLEWLPRLAIVGGKGGVGKTTVACALALAASERFSTLLVSTDPAPSLADALAQDIPDAETQVVGAPRLRARQMDASAAFARLRDEYAARVDALFASLMGSGVNLDRDHAIARELLALAPPGVDEVYALTLLADAMTRGTHERVVVDPAPTGHLVRLLAMPEVALAWTHQLMRLMLKYKDVAGLGETAGDLLAFARDLRALDELLRDPRRSALVLVTLDEPVVRAESGRLIAAAAERGLGLRAVVHNRGGSHALPVDAAVVQVVAPGMEPPPVGADAIRKWTARWTRLAGGGDSPIPS